MSELVAVQHIVEKFKSWTMTEQVSSGLLQLLARATVMCGERSGLKRHVHRFPQKEIFLFMKKN